MLCLRRFFLRPPTIMSTVATSGQRNLVATSKDYQLDMPAVSEPKDLLRKSIYKSQTKIQLQSVIDQHLHVMNNKHLLDCMVLYKRLTSGTASSLAEDEPFKGLATRILLKMRFFDMNDCVHLARIAGDLGLDCSSSLVQGILQMVRRRLSDLDIQQVMTLRVSLKKLKGSSLLSDTLQLSLPVVFECQIRQQLDHSDMEMCLKAVKFAVSTNINKQNRDFIANAAQIFVSQCTPEQALHILYSSAFSDKDRSKNFGSKLNNIMRDCMKIVAQELNRVDTKNLRRIMAAYVAQDVYSKELNDAFWSLAPSWSFDEISRLVSASLQMDSLTRYEAILLKDLILLHKEEVLTDTQFSISDCATAMALLALQTSEVDYKLIEVGHLLSSSLDQRKNLQGSPKQFLRLMESLVLLEAHPEEELDILFSEGYQKLFLAFKFSHVERLIDLERWLQIRFGDSVSYRVLPELREYVASKKQKPYIQEELIQIMETALGGGQFLLKNLATPTGVEADLAVVMRQGEFPIALADKENPLEDLPKDCKVVAILQSFKVRDYLHSRDFKRVHFALRERFLVNQNIYPVTLRMEEWLALPQNEKIPFIMRKIKDVLRDSQAYDS